MPTKTQLRERLLQKLLELFQLDQPDLDFGFYRIMHARADKVTRFLKEDLVGIVIEELKDTNVSKEAELQQRFDEELERAREYNVPNPHEADRVKQAKLALDAARNRTNAESEIYDHLFRFFDRYYDGGDFMPMRYYMRKTSTTASPYAIPYNGEEIQFHWANADQYYVKTTELFSHFAFNIRNIPEIRDRKLPDMEPTLVSTAQRGPLRVVFRTVSASEGEHGNIKVSELDQRFFVLANRNSVTLTKDNALAIAFEYRADPKKSKKSGKMWQFTRNQEAADTILAQLSEMKESRQQFSTDQVHKIAEYITLLGLDVPRGKNDSQTLLAKYINKYTTRNTADYFIHKDLGEFLRRELDFYIKNEVVNLDDIIRKDAAGADEYLAKVKALRRIAGNIITFLAQLENFQKKLWLKKKFVVDTQYCISIDRVPATLYSEILTNQEQIAEWIRMYSLDTLPALKDTSDVASAIDSDFLKRHDKMMLDTKYFDAHFKHKLIASIDDFDTQCNGLLIHSENFQALNLLRERYRNKIKCIYIDPPYNTSGSEILYKNAYKHSSWCSLMYDRMVLSRALLTGDGVIQIAVDDAEFHRLEGLTRRAFGESNYIGNVAILSNPEGRYQVHIADCHEYTVLAAKCADTARTFRLPLSEEELQKKYPKGEGETRYREIPLRRSGLGAKREDRPYMYYPFVYHRDDLTLKVVEEDEYMKIWDENQFDDDYVSELQKKYEQADYHFILPIRDDGSKGRWCWGYASAKKGIENGILFARMSKSGPAVFRKSYIEEGMLPKSFWKSKRYDASTNGTTLLKNIVPGGRFDFPKSIYTVADMITIGSAAPDTVLDYFAGSGTTGHAIINMNRDEGGDGRKYILAEMGAHFDTVLKPRVIKAAYAPEWKEGKPLSHDAGISHCIKYIRLESYEDTLNNLKHCNQEMEAQCMKQSDAFRREYMLSYFLDVGTQGSGALVNIETFDDPWGYTIDTKQPEMDGSVTSFVDLVETFNFLIGMQVDNTGTLQRYSATFRHEIDHDTPEENRQKLIVDGNLRRVGRTEDEVGLPSWRFQAITGLVSGSGNSKRTKDPSRVLIIWRSLSEDIEKDNAVLEAWFRSHCMANRETHDYDLVYVNGSNSLQNLAPPPPPPMGCTAYRR